MEQQMIEKIREKKLIAITRGVAPERIEKTAQALSEGGIGLMEITFDQRTDGADTVKSIALLRERFEGKIYPGAGTVMTAEQVRLAAEAGAQYIISPNTDRAVIEETKRLGLVSIPGAFTPTEIAAAYQMGADFVKIFPVASLGAAYIKAVTAPLAHIPVLAVGGVTPANLKEFFKAGAVGCGIGSNLVNASKIAAGDYASVTEAAKAFCAALRCGE